MTVAETALYRWRGDLLRKVNYGGGLATSRACCCPCYATLGYACQFGFDDSAPESTFMADLDFNIQNFPGAPSLPNWNHRLTVQQRNFPLKTDYWLCNNYTLFYETCIGLGNEPAMENLPGDYVDWVNSVPPLNANGLPAAISGAGSAAFFAFTPTHNVNLILDQLSLVGLFTYGHICDQVGENGYDDYGEWEVKAYNPPKICPCD